LSDHDKFSVLKLANLFWHSK